MKLKNMGGAKSMTEVRVSMTRQFKKCRKINRFNSYRWTIFVFLTPIYLIFILNSAHRLPGKLVIAIACHFRAVTFISENVHNQHCFFVKTRLALHQRKICWLFITNACFPSIFVSVHRSSHAISTVEESQRSISGKQDEIWTLAWLKFFCSIYCADLQKILFLTVNGEEETLWT